MILAHQLAERLKTVDPFAEITVSAVGIHVIPMGEKPEPPSLIPVPVQEVFAENVIQESEIIPLMEIGDLKDIDVTVSYHFGYKPGYIQLSDTGMAIFTVSVPFSGCSSSGTHYGKIAEEIVEEYDSLSKIKEDIRKNKFKVGGINEKKQKLLLRLR